MLTEIFESLAIPAVIVTGCVGVAQAAQSIWKGRVNRIEEENKLAEEDEEKVNTSGSESQKEEGERKLDGMSKAKLRLHIAGLRKEFDSISAAFTGLMISKFKEKLLPKIKGRVTRRYTVDRQEGVTCEVCFESGGESGSSCFRLERRKNSGFFSLLSSSSKKKEYGNMSCADCMVRAVRVELQGLLFGDQVNALGVCDPKLCPPNIMDIIKLVIAMEPFIKEEESKEVLQEVWCLVFEVNKKKLHEVNNSISCPYFGCPATNRTGVSECWFCIRSVCPAGCGSAHPASEACSNAQDLPSKWIKLIIEQNESFPPDGINPASNSRLPILTNFLTICPQCWGVQVKADSCNHMAERCPECRCNFHCCMGTSEMCALFAGSNAIPSDYGAQPPHYGRVMYLREIVRLMKEQKGGATPDMSILDENFDDENKKSVYKLLKQLKGERYLVPHVAKRTLDKH